MSVPRIASAVALGAAALLALAGCASQPTAEADEKKPAASTVTVEDNNGSHKISTPPASVVATDNRTFQTLSDWGIELSAAAVSLMPETVSYAKENGIVDLGTHMEPDLESVVAVAPDLIINGLGGVNLRPINDTLQKNSLATYNENYGVLKLNLTDTTFQTELVTIDGHVQDSSPTYSCH